MVAPAIDVSAYAGGYIVEVEGAVVGGTSLEELEAKLRERGYDETNMPVMESIPPAGVTLF